MRACSTPVGLKLAGELTSILYKQLANKDKQTTKKELIIKMEVIHKARFKKGRKAKSILTSWK